MVGCEEVGLRVVVEEQKVPHHHPRPSRLLLARLGVMLGVALARALVVLALAATALAADFYAALGVSRQAGDRELKKACTFCSLSSRARWMAS